MTAQPGPPSHLHDLLELSSFSATTDLQITDMWNADKAVASRMWLTGLDDAFNDPGCTDSLKTQAITAHDSIRRVIEAVEARDRRSADDKTHILILLENIGVLCDEGFVSPAIVVDFIGAPIVWPMELLADYVMAIRQAEPSAYCRAIALYDVARRAAG